MNLGLNMAKRAALNGRLNCLITVIFYGFLLFEKIHSLLALIS